MSLQDQVNKRYQEVCEKYGEKNVFFLYLYGSQNYGLDTKKSDIDTKAIIFLPEEQMIWRQSIDEYMTFDNGELCQIIDLVTFIRFLLMYRLTYLECFISSAIIINPRYAQLFEEFKHLDHFVYDYDQRNFVRELIESSQCDWNYFKSNEKDLLLPKIFTHAYRKMAMAKHILMGGSYSNGIKMDKEQTDKLRNIKISSQVPEYMQDEYRELSERTINLYQQMDKEQQSINKFQIFCQKAYKQYNSN